VETIKRSLSRHIKNQTIKNIEIRETKLFRGDKNEVVGQAIEEIERRAKMLIWKLSNGRYLLFHLKMTGQLLYDSTDHQQVAGGGHPDKVYLQPPPHKFTHIILTLNKGKIYFNDLRKFGWVKVLDESALKNEVASIGPEIDWPEFSFEYFQKAINRRAKTKIKTALMDQTILAGVGNIYSDETLFCAKILPTRLVKDLSGAKLEAIFDCLPKVMGLAIKHGGTSLKDYRRLDGSMGDYLKHANVYHRTGEPCRVCKTPVKRVVVNGRSAHFCPNCQR